MMRAAVISVESGFSLQGSRHWDRKGAKFLLGRTFKIGTFHHMNMTGQAGSFCSKQERVLLEITSLSSTSRRMS